jgi:hypothetical protein
MNEKEAYERQLQAQLDEWNAEINKLKAKAAKAEADAQIESVRYIEELERQQQKAQEKLRELQKSSEDAWNDLKVGLDSAWRNLDESIRSASSRFT